MVSYFSIKIIHGRIIPGQSKAFFFYVIILAQHDALCNTTVW